MKKLINRFLILSAGAMLLFSSCSEWLTVYSDTDVLEEDLFSTGDGYRYALNGAYELMASTSLYGKQLTYGFATIMSDLYLESSVTNNSYFHDYYEDYLGGLPESDNMIDYIYDPIWAKAFQVVVNVNNILSFIEDEPVTTFEFKEYERDIIIGECYAIRALMHFEMFRFFGYGLWEDGASEARLPYVTDPETIVPTYYNSSDYLDLIVADLELASEYTKEYDLLVTEEFTNSRFDTSIYSVDEISDGNYLFMSARGYRLNYFAIQVLLARAYMYTEDYNSAYATASNLYSYGPEGEGYIEYSTFTSTNTKMASELLFASYNEDMREDYMTDIGYDEGYRMAIANAVDYFNGDIDDARYTELLDDGVYSNRWHTEIEFAECYIPIIRYSEAVHIMAECMTRTECSSYNLTGALELLDTFVSSGRSVHTSRATLYANSSAEQVREVIWNDIIRETMDEGHMPWVYKRNGTGFKYHDGALPLPLEETNYTSYND